METKLELNANVTWRSNRRRFPLVDVLLKVLGLQLLEVTGGKYFSYQKAGEAALFSDGHTSRTPAVMSE